MNKDILVGLIVIAFCITWWVIAGEAWQASTQADRARRRAKRAYEETMHEHERAELIDWKSHEWEVQARDRAEQAREEAGTPAGTAGIRALEPAVQWKLEEAKQSNEQFRKRTLQAYSQASQAYHEACMALPTARAHYDTRFKWGIGAGLLVDVLLLVGALAWSKLTANP